MIKRILFSKKYKRKKERKRKCSNEVIKWMLYKSFPVNFQLIYYNKIIVEANK